jgi:pyruvate ferredoxin oxidoreductase alpha subunit
MENKSKQKRSKPEWLAMNGDEAVAYAVKQSDVDVVAAYPITPQTIIVEKYSEYVADGEVQTEFVCTESEHSAMTACIAAEATGARTFTASASAGLALMHEMLFVCSGCRMPVVMAVANRALSAPLNIHGDQSDSMAQRDSGWIQIYVENAQEAYDTIIQAFRIAEDHQVLLPVMVGLDGYTISHTLENVNVLGNDAAAQFVGPHKLIEVMTQEGKAVPFKLDPDNPMTMGPIAMQNYYFEFKRQQEEAMKNALSVIQEINSEYAKISGRSYGNGLLDEYSLGDAEIAIVCIGSTAGTLKTIVDKLREEGVKAGLLRIRTFIPLPVEEIRRALRSVKAIAVMDKSVSFGGFGGPVFTAVHHALYGEEARPHIVDYIYGLGGRDTHPRELRRIYEDLQHVLHTNHVDKTIHYIGLRE